MTIGIRSMDHPVIAVRDMVGARITYERLGFTIPPRGSHLEWGTGNWCIMFEADYLELRGIVDAGRYLHHLDEFLAVREGLMGVAFNVADGAAAFAAARQAGLSPPETRVVTRRFELPEGETRPSFRLVFLPPENTPGLEGCLMIEHLTPGLLRRPEWLRHANTARYCAALVAVVPDPEALAAAYSRLFGPAAVRAMSGGLVIACGGHGRLRALTPEAARREGTELPGLTAPYMAALDIAVDDPGTAEATLVRNGVPFTRVGDAIHVSAEQACGTVLRFVSAEV